MRFKFARRPTTGRAYVCAEREDRAVSADHIRQDAARQAQVLSLRDRRESGSPPISIAGSRPVAPLPSAWRARVVGGGITKATPAPQARRLAPDQAYPSVSSMSWPIWVALQRRTPRAALARLGSTRNDRHVWSVPDLCARRSDRLLAGQSVKVIPAASYRHAPLDVARPQPNVVPAEWPHGAAHSESRP
jgi:hypothetical protein